MLPTFTIELATNVQQNIMHTGAQLIISQMIAIDYYHEFKQSRTNVTETPPSHESIFKIQWWCLHPGFTLSNCHIWPTPLTYKYNDIHATSNHADKLILEHLCELEFIDL